MPNRTPSPFCRTAFPEVLFWEISGYRSSNLGEFAEAWQRLGAVMAPGGSIDIFGCNVAAGSNGQNLINDIGRLSRTTVFASVDDTGRGGNWVLEAASTTGNASAWQNPLNTEMLRQWNGLLTSIVVTNTNDSGPGSLRQAIFDANANPGMDYITFTIPGTGVHTITTSRSAILNITDPVTIDGYTQSGASANTNTLARHSATTPFCRSNSAGATLDIGGLTLDVGSSGSTIRGLAIIGFKDSASNREFTSSRTTTSLSGNFIGTNAAGTAALGNSLRRVHSQRPIQHHRRHDCRRPQRHQRQYHGRHLHRHRRFPTPLPATTSAPMPPESPPSPTIIGIYTFHLIRAPLSAELPPGRAMSSRETRNCGIHMDWGISDNRDPRELHRHERRRNRRSGQRYRHMGQSYDRTDDRRGNDGRQRYQRQHRRRGENFR